MDEKVEELLAKWTSKALRRGRNLGPRCTIEIRPLKIQPMTGAKWHGLFGCAKLHRAKEDPNRSNQIQESGAWQQSVSVNSSGMQELLPFTYVLSR